jgi:acetoin utilization deacetylase AcuC-like enzyme
MLHIAWHPLFHHPLPEGHRFPMLKYDLIPEQLLHEGTIQPENLFRPALPDEADLLRTHTPEYWNKLKGQTLSAKEIRKIGFPFSPLLVEREQVIAAGTIQCALYALEFGVSLNVAGGTHHAYADRGEGFCILNDQAIAANYLLAKQLADKILIVDLDVHQGNGTAAIFAQQKNVATLSIHGANNYPAYKESSTYDIALPDQTSDELYLQTLYQHLPVIVKQEQPDFIFYQSGVDILTTDKLGKLSVSMEGCKERDRYVLQLCKNLGIPIAISMGGGYSEKISDIVEAHCNTFRLAQDIYF